MNDTPEEPQDQSAWANLRRRKVVQWGLFYAAASWGFLQGLAYISGTFDWPRQIQQFATLALLIGLPIVLVLACTTMLTGSGHCGPVGGKRMA